VPRTKSPVKVRTSTADAGAEGDYILILGLRQPVGKGVGIGNLCHGWNEGNYENNYITFS